jgi:hypothetical protein
MPNPKIDRALGGSPLSIAVKLLFLSLIVGAVMAFLGLTPRSLFDALRTFAQSIIDMGADAFWQVAQWIVAGALIVVPVWLLIRLFGRR